MRRATLCLLVMLTVGCVKVEQPELHPQLSIEWETESDSVHVQLYSGGHWHTVANGPAVGVVSIQASSGLYRLLAFKGRDSSYSKVIAVR